MCVCVCVCMHVCECVSVPSRAAGESGRVSGQGAPCAPRALVCLPGGPGGGREGRALTSAAGTGAPEGEPECRPLVGTPGTSAEGPWPQPQHSAESPSNSWAPASSRAPTPAPAFFAFIQPVAPGNSEENQRPPALSMWSGPPSPGAACSKRFSRSCPHLSV